MSSPLGVDPNTLRMQADELAALANERADHEQRVAEIGADLADDWTGETGAAIQKALANYLTQAADVRREEMEIAEAMREAANRYENADTEGASGLSNSMGI